jgi:membrane protein implicated in regulation of membrane protease activity
MTWWAWIVGGAILLGAELSFVDAQFYMVFVGGSAILVGILAGAAPDFPVWAQWAAFALLSLVSMFTFRRRFYERIKGRGSPFSNNPKDTVFVLAEELAPGASCRMEHGGTTWTVRNDGQVALDRGARVHVVKVDGLTLQVRGA